MMFYSRVTIAVKVDPIYMDRNIQINKPRECPQEQEIWLFV